MIKGIGVDIVDLHRIAKIHEKLAKKILTEQEYQSYVSKQSEIHKIEYVGGRFAVKEAVFKAANLEIQSFQEIEILTGPKGQPLCNIEHMHISLAHEEKYAIAYVIYEE